jgi:3-oxoacyl-[acyl-carrier protein] reductase
MKQQRRGKIVNISSGTVFYGAPLVAHYVTSKAGVIGLTRSLARELGEYNINVNAIAPGLTMSMEEVSEARTAQNQQRLQARSIKRTEVPQDLVGTVVFLCSIALQKYATRSRGWCLYRKRLLRNLISVEIVYERLCKCSAC